MPYRGAVRDSGFFGQVEAVAFTIGMVESRVQDLASLLGHALTDIVRTVCSEPTRTMVVDGKPAPPT
jgi:hypothetical protein